MNDPFDLCDLETTSVWFVANLLVATGSTAVSSANPLLEPGDVDRLLTLALSILLTSEPSLEVNPTSEPG